MPLLLWVVILIVLLLIVVLVRKVIAEMSRHISYYLPPTSIGQLSKELQSQLIIAQAHVERLQQHNVEYATAVESIQLTLSLCEMLRETMLVNVKGNLNDWLAVYGTEVMDSVIRDASSTLVQSIENGLLDRTTSLLGGYVLLQSLDDLSIDVKLDARYVDPEGIRQAVLKLLEWEPAKVRAIHGDRDIALRFMEQTKSRRELDLFLGRLGEHLLKLSWDGKAALSCQPRALAQ